MSASNRQSPSVTMSRPATSCSCRYTDRASTYCSRNRDSTIASRNERVLRFSVYQLGRGSEPVMVVGMIFPAVAFSIGSLLVRSNLVRYQPPERGVNCVGRNSFVAAEPSGPPAQANLKVRLYIRAYERTTRRTGAGGD